MRGEASPTSRRRGLGVVAGDPDTARGVEGKNPSSPSQFIARAKPKRGRPRIGEPFVKYEPWLALNMSRATFYRRKAEQREKQP